MSREAVSLLHVSGLTKHFGGVTAVDKVDLQISSGEVIALIGPNGAGKTTFFNIISGIIRPDTGRLLLNGADVTGLPSWRMAEMGIGRTFQNIRLFADLTVAENVALAAKGPLLSPLPRDSVAGLLSLAKIDGYADRIAGSLPYGIRRQVELARALAGRPKLLLLDEPCAGMNASESMQLVESVRSLAKSGLAILLIEHNVRVAMAAAQRVVVLNFGRKIAEGSPEVVQKDSAVIEAYLGKTGREKTDV